MTNPFGRTRGAAQVVRFAATLWRLFLRWLCWPLELGLKGFDAGTTHAFYAPAGAPAAVIERLNRD